MLKLFRPLAACLVLTLMSAAPAPAQSPDAVAAAKELLEVMHSADNFKTMMPTIMQALKLYRLDNQRYPTTEQGLVALVARPTEAPIPANWKPNGYLERLPKDPWGRPYQYLNPGLRGEIDVFSFGADGQPGGAGIDADVGSWDL